MKIAGIQKMTLLDYPGKVACTLFGAGCNFRCPFCHNGELVINEVPSGLDEEELLAFLKSRRAFLDGVCISGGEPTVQKQLPNFVQKLKALGYPVKLDTNGYNPRMLRELMAAGWLDYVAMDIKNAPSRYAETVGLPKVDIEKIEESISVLTGGKTDYEFRTTVVAEFHDGAAFSEMGQWLQRVSGENGVSALFLQPYVERDTVIRPGLHSPETEKLREYQEILTQFVRRVEIRGRE